MAQVSYTCTFSDPKYVDGSTPTTPLNYSFQWQFNKETCTYNTGMYAPSTTIASSSDIAVYGSFTAGEIVMSFLMFMLIVIELGKVIAQGLEKITTKRTFIRYQNADTEINDDL
jgi:ABC-type transport system involved in Fe-S cluster assembly fused permease/ATPase subunit